MAGLLFSHESNREDTHKEYMGSIPRQGTVEAYHAPRQ